MSGGQPETVGSSRWSRRGTSITRQGTTAAVPALTELTAQGGTGLPEVDMWVMSLREGNKRRRATVMLPAWVRSRPRHAGT
jgi:hypothetical protein